MDQIIPHTEQDKKHLIDSIKNVIIDIASNVDYYQYHDSKFEDNFKNEVYQSFHNIDFEKYEDIYETIKEDVIISNSIVWRSLKTELVNVFDNCSNKNFEKVNHLKTIPQPEQRTQEWYKFRQDHLTGSNLWKIFQSDSCKNQLYYEKLYFSEPDQTRPNLNDQLPMNWGHKYEDLSILFYEYYNDVIVEEFGCIEHASIPYLAASPDGIVTSKKNNGRMVEIKNPTTREITQIPKMEYYIQMQLQMEVCDMDDCDFVETKFKEYETFQKFKNDKYKIEKGLIIVLIKNNLQLVYEYMPLFQNSDIHLSEFTNKIYHKYGLTDDKLENGEYKWFKNIYWYLDTFSCVYVPRNKIWFKCVLPEINDFWENVVKERTIPNSHLKYKPNKRKKKDEQIITLS